MFCVVCYDMGWNGEPRLPMSLDLREIFSRFGCDGSEVCVPDCATVALRMI